MSTPTACAPRAAAAPATWPVPVATSRSDVPARTPTASSSGSATRAVTRPTTASYASPRPGSRQPATSSSLNASVTAARAPRAHAPPTARVPPAPARVSRRSPRRARARAGGRAAELREPRQLERARVVQIGFSVAEVVDQLLARRVDPPAVDERYQAKS